MGVGRDFNCEPAELAATGWLELVEGTVQAPEGATCNQRKLDFFVVSKDLVHAVKGVFVVGDSPSSPHSAVRLVLDSKCRSDTIRELKRQPKITAFQPNGPMPKDYYGDRGEACTVAELVDPVGAMAAAWAWANYSGIVVAIEDQICYLNCLDEQERAKHSRSSGPQHVTRTGAGPPHQPGIADLDAIGKLAQNYGVQAEHSRPTP